MENIEKLKNIISIIQKGKKPMSARVFYSANENYEFNGKHHKYDELRTALEEYSTIEGVPNIIFRRTNNGKL